VGPKPDVWEAELPPSTKAADLLKARGGVLHLCSTCRHSVQYLEVVQSESGNTHHQHRSFCSLLTEDGGDSLEHEGPVHYCSRYRPSLSTMAMRVAAHAYVSLDSILARTRRGARRSVLDDVVTGAYPLSRRERLKRALVALRDVLRDERGNLATPPPDPLAPDPGDQWRRIAEAMRVEEAEIADVMKEIGGVFSGGPFAGGHRV
ncbi:MAG TPA: hypothetical protein VFO62_00665, partial [Candidatus Binatia bacterium]|nr:hypothetical protein [Candidatus Binatia bacterium]